MRPSWIALVVIVGAVPALGAAPSDPWSRVPALPTACYQADFPAKVAAAKEANARDRDQQEKINDVLREKLKNADMTELAQRQQQYMMDHPQEAMALMQRNQALGEMSVADGAREQEGWKQLLQEREALEARYRAALDAQLAPVKRKYDDLDQRAKPHLILVGEAGTEYPDWAIAEFNKIQIEENATYERVCKEWWAATGPFHSWLRRARAHGGSRVPAREEAELVGAGFLVQLFGTPAQPFRPLATMDAVRDYLAEVDRVFANRRDEPVKPYVDHFERQKAAAKK